MATLDMQCILIGIYTFIIEYEDYVTDSYLRKVLQS